MQIPLSSSHTRMTSVIAVTTSNYNQLFYYDSDGNVSTNDSMSSHQYPYAYKLSRSSDDQSLNIKH